MAALSDYAEKLLLDWAMTTGSATRPTAWYVALYTAAPSDSGGILPADWDMFKRVMMNVKDKGKNYMYIPKVTSFYRNREGKF